MTGVLDLAWSADAAYLPHVAASVRSALLAASDPARINVHFMYPQGGVPEQSLARLERMTKRLGGCLHCYAIPAEKVDGLPVTARISAAMWNRVFLPELLPDVSRVLYLDADTIVMRPLDKLWDLGMDGLALAAVDNVLEQRFQGRPAQLGLPASQRYFNSGVLLMNLDWWRIHGTTEKLLDYAANRELLWPDQDALNVVLGSKRLTLAPDWNTQNSLYFLDEAPTFFDKQALQRVRQSPAILHFEGPGFAKPWHVLCAHPLKSQYRRHRLRTPWPFYWPYYRIPGVPKRILIKQAWHVLIGRHFSPRPW